MQSLAKVPFWACKFHAGWQILRITVLVLPGSDDVDDTGLPERKENLKIHHVPDRGTERVGKARGLESAEVVEFRLSGNV